MLPEELFPALELLLFPLLPLFPEFPVEALPFPLFVFPLLLLLPEVLPFAGLLSLVVVFLLSLPVFFFGSFALSLEAVSVSSGVTNSPSAVVSTMIWMLVSLLLPLSSVAVKVLSYSPASSYWMYTVFTFNGFSPFTASVESTASVASSVLTASSVDAISSVPATSSAVTAWSATESVTLPEYSFTDTTEVTSNGCPACKCNSSVVTSGATVSFTSTLIFSTSLS